MEAGVCWVGKSHKSKCLFKVLILLYNCMFVRWFCTIPDQALMRAAGYGKSFLSDYDSDEFVECCRKLRVLNNCRHKSAGIPITSQQYDRLTPDVRTPSQDLSVSLQITAVFLVECDIGDSRREAFTSFFASLDHPHMYTIIISNKN